jgi:hypothetical protein
MVTGTGAVGSTNQFDLNLSNASSANTTDAFAQQLATAIEGYLGKINNGSHFEIDVQSGSPNDFTISVKNLGAGASVPVTPTTPAASTNPATPPAAAGASQTPVDAPVDKSKMTPTDAYWAEQPTAVQALRNIPEDERYAAAQDLAKQGYTIDVPIMVWGWDPLVTMTLRQNEGYTWVPSALQPNIPIGPGIANVWNVPSYDPNNPPPGSIKVSTDFAIGTNMQDPWMKTLNT